MGKNTLKLYVNEGWFDVYWEGLFFLDHREVKPYWESRLLTKKGHFREYDKIAIINGYGENRPTLIFKASGISLTEPGKMTHLGNKQVFEIKLGDFISMENALNKFKKEKARTNYFCDLYRDLALAGKDVSGLPEQIHVENYFMKKRVVSSDGKRKIYRVSIPAYKRLNRTSNEK